MTPQSEEPTRTQSRTVNFNVGGQFFEVARETIDLYPDALLAKVPRPCRVLGTRRAAVWAAWGRGGEGWQRLRRRGAACHSVAVRMGS